MPSLRRPRRSRATASAIVASATVLTFVPVVCSAVIGFTWWPLHLVSRTAVLGAAGDDWGAPWEALARPPAAYQSEALGAQILTLRHLAITAIAIAALCLMLHALSRVLAEWHSMAIRHALGATTRHLLPRVAGELIALGAVGNALGLGAGAILVAALSERWPALLTRPPLALSAVAAAALALVVVCLLLAFLAALPLTILQRGVRTASELHGSQVTASGPVLLIQSTLAVLQLAALLMVTYGSALLVADARIAHVPEASAPPGSAVAAPLTFQTASPDARAAGYRRLESVLDGAAPARVAITSPDAWLGMGRELPMLALCEECRVGSDIRPMSAARVRVVAEAPEALVALGARVTRGRAILAGDTIGAPLVAVLNAAAVFALYPGGDPLGKPLLAGTSPPLRYTVVGVTPFEAPRVFGNPDHVPMVFVSAFQHPPQRAEAVTQRRPWEALRSRVGAVSNDAGAPLPHLGAATPLASRQGTFTAPLIWFGALFAVLALSGTGIAVYSLIAVMNEMVRLRERNIAIRMAVGAQARHIEWWVARRTLRITLAGVLVGVSGARWVGVLLHGPERSAEGDVALLGVMILAFGALGLAASWLPARRAARVSPAAVFADQGRRTEPARAIPPSSSPTSRPGTSTPGTARR
jgi:putative ABC transport system permease protein